VLAGDAAVFGALVEKYQGLAYSIAYRTLQDAGAAGDAVQDSFVKAYRALHQFQGVSFKSWFMRIVVNTCYDIVRSSHWRNTESLGDLPVEDENAASLIDEAESPHEHAERVELSAWIEAAIAQLPADQRMALVLCDVHGHTYEEIAEMTGQAMGTVKSRISRARSRLRDILLRKPELLPAAFRRRDE